MLLVASCSDVATAPTRDAQRGISQPAPSFSMTNLGAFGFAPASITLTANGGTFVIGQYTLTVPPNAVCDPTQSTYGPTEWDQPCVTLAPGHSVVVFAGLSLGASALGVDFSPALRFSPDAMVTMSTGAFSTTLLTNTAYYSANPGALNSLVMYYAQGSGLPAEMDFATDPSVITHVNMTTGRVWRRVKHFSGYIISVGLACTPSPDVPECVQVDQ